MNEAAAPARRHRVASVGKAMRLLQAFTPLTTTLSVRELAELTGVPRSTVHALCVTLEDAGMLEQTSSNGYRLGWSVVGLGGQVIDRVGMVDVADQVLQEIHRREGCEVHLAQLVGSWVVYLDRASGVIRAPMNNRIGLRAPAHITGCGRAALSMLDPADAIKRVEEASHSERQEVPDRNVLRRDLTSVRQQGYVVNTSFQTGRLSVAAPVLDHAGQPVGGVSVAGPKGLFDSRAAYATAREIVRAASTISRRLSERELER